MLVVMIIRKLGKGDLETEEEKWMRRRAIKRIKIYSFYVPISKINVNFIYPKYVCIKITYIKRNILFLKTSKFKVFGM